MTRPTITYRPHHCEHDDSPDGCTHEGMTDARCSDCDWADAFSDEAAARHIGDRHARNHAEVLRMSAISEKRPRRSAETS